MAALAGGLLVLKEKTNENQTSMEESSNTTRTMATLRWFGLLTKSPRGPKLNKETSMFWLIVTIVILFLIFATPD